MMYSLWDPLRSLFFLLQFSRLRLIIFTYLITTTKTNPTGNADQFVTLGRKLAFYNGYKPQRSIDLYETTGTTVDTYYGNYGVAAFVYEVCLVELCFILKSWCNPNAQMISYVIFSSGRVSFRIVQPLRTKSYPITCQAWCMLPKWLELHSRQ